MTREDAIDIIKSECYVFNPLNFDRSTMVNTALDMAVKALKQQPCEDVISRTEEPVKLQWIPVTERLPEIYQSVLVWCPLSKNIYCAWYSDGGAWVIFGGNRTLWEEVTAWQSLPEPPEEVEE